LVSMYPSGHESQGQGVRIALMDITGELLDTVREDVSNKLIIILTRISSGLIELLSRKHLLQK